MLIRRLGYFSKEAWVSIKRGGIMTFVATSTIAISLFILGVFLLIFFNLHNLLDVLNSKLDIVAYVRPGLAANDLDLINLTIAQIPGVKKIKFVSREAAWQEFKETYTNLRLDDVLDANPLPDSFKIEVNKLSSISAVAEKLSALSGIEDVRYGGDIAERVGHFIRVISSAGIIIVLLLGISTLMIVVNTIRLTVIARENEINIMSLVGATKQFIKYPFILEGVYLGMLGGLMALLGLKAGYDLAVINIEKNIPFLPMNLNVKEINFIFLIVFLTGIFLGWLGGYVSVSKSLRTE